MTTHARTHLSTEIQHNGAQTIAATIHWPNDEALRRHPPVLACFAGAGYNRRYFDLPEPGYSEAEHHVASGMIVIAIDNLATGESSIPPPENTRLHDVATANHAALTALLGKLRSGTLGTAGPISTGPIIGVGHSMGGIIGVVMQARHRSFDGLAALGSTMVSVRLPSTTPWHEVRLPPGVDSETPAGYQVLMSTDWRLISYWDDVPEHLAAADMAVSSSTGGPTASWRSATLPNVGSPLQRASVAREAALLDVPLLFAIGERDVCHDYLREIAAFHSARDISIFEAPRMAHMHNFAGTRALMWRRVEAFARQVQGMKAGDA